MGGHEVSGDETGDATCGAGGAASFFASNHALNLSFSYQRNDPNDRRGDGGDPSQLPKLRRWTASLRRRRQQLRTQQQSATMASPTPASATSQET